MRAARRGPSGLGLFLCSVFVLFATTQGILLSVIMSRDGDQLLVQTVMVNINGVITNITNNGYMPLDGPEIGFGISTFDTKRGIYYFADDTSNTAIIHSTDIFHQTAQPDVNLSVVSVTAFNFDNVNDRLLMFYTNGDQPQVLATFQNNKLQALWKVPLNLAITSVGFDEAGQRLFMINATAPHNQVLTVLELNTLKSTTFTLSSACRAFRYSGRLLWSPIYNKAFTFVVTPNANNPNELDTYVVAIDPTTGSCQAILTQVPPGPLLDWQIDNNMGMIYFFQQVVPGVLLYVYDINRQIVLVPAEVQPISAFPMNFVATPF